jgi:radical SAM protein with 4Fe4S-binding SPASM domain
MNDLSLIAINLTRRCNLACTHCYLDTDTLLEGSKDELTAEEVCLLLDEVAECGDGTMVVLTGGEPLVRRDVEDIAAHGVKLGLAMVVGSNGTLLTKSRVEGLKLAGVLGVGISLDSLYPDYHDAFRGMKGCWEKTLTGIENCRRLGLDFQIHFTVTEGNAHELDSMIDFARHCGARVFNVFFLVCTGRGEAVTDITALHYEQVLNELIDAQQRSQDLIIRARCAPHFKRIALQRDPVSPLNRISGQEADGCIAATHYCRITPEGGVTACPYIPDEVGNIREQDFSELWQSAPEFKLLRNPVLNGACGACEFRKLCGGCRARPITNGQGLMDEDPLCAYDPKGGDVIQPLRETDCNIIHWSQAAELRLSRIPAFLRKLVKKRAEAYVLELGETTVTPEHLSVLAAKRFGNSIPRHPVREYNRSHGTD